MHSRINSFGLRGVEAYPVQVELDFAGGLPGYATVGLPDSAVKESRERVASAVRNSGFKVPSRKITVNLAPAQSRKEGTHFDLPIALALLSASGHLPFSRWPERVGFVGELALDGGLRPVRGVLAMAINAREQGYETLVVPQENAAEASAAGIKTVAAGSLKEVIAWVTNGDLPRPAENGAKVPGLQPFFEEEDIADVKGQPFAKRALEIAAAGGHNLILIGPPGCGKSMLAKRLPGLLPEMTEGERLEVTRIQAAVKGSDNGNDYVGLAQRRPFRAPHHNTSAAALVGGGPAGRPGEISLAHAGVLFMDELAEFQRPALEALRQPLEDRRVVVARAREILSYPANFIFIAAANPCPCGWLGHEKRECLCTPQAVARYVSRLSGPLMDRIDLQVELSSVPPSLWAKAEPGPSSAELRARVLAARRVQARRLGREDFALNALLPARALTKRCAVTPEALELLERTAAKYAFSARVLERSLKVARTIADLAASVTVESQHLAEALTYRCLDRRRRMP